jgi:hypothetical protein
MKRMSIVFALGSALFLLAACADPMEQRTTSEVQGQLQRGVTGQGQIGPEERAPGDPANEHGIPQNHP